MHTRRLPGTDLELSVVGLGCWAMGGLWWGSDVRDDDSVAAVHKALELGINWFDTAPLYGHGHADEVLVRALGARKKDVLIATKVGVRWDGEGMHARSDLSPAWLRADVEASLRRLGLERIDLLQVHWPDEGGVPLAETLATLETLKREGKVRHVGLCNYDPTGLSQAVTHGPIASLQTPYNLLRREFESGLQPWLTAHGIGAVVYEPLCRGLLTGKFTARQRFGDDDLRARDDRFQGTRFLRALTVVSRLQLIAQRLHVPLAALALAWTLRNPAVTAAIAGAKRPAQVAEFAGVEGLLAREDLWPEVDRVVASYRG